MDVLSRIAVNTLHCSVPDGPVGGWRQLWLVVLRRGRSRRCRPAGLPCRTRLPPGPRGGGLRRYGLRLNKTKTRGERVPIFGGGNRVPGCLLGVMAAVRTSVGRPGIAPPGKISEPFCTARKERHGFCFWFFVCSAIGAAHRSKVGGDGDCCFLFSECSTS